MKVELITCNAQRPDRRAISKLLLEFGKEMDQFQAEELTEILLDGTPVNFELIENTSSSGLRQLRKLNIDYEFA